MVCVFYVLSFLNFFLFCSLIITNDYLNRIIKTIEQGDAREEILYPALALTIRIQQDH